MDIILCTGGRSVEAWFAPLTRSKKNSLSVIKPFDFPGKLKKLSNRHLVYLDISPFPEEEWQKHLRALLKKENLRVGVIDPKNTVRDPGGFFHSGAVDYIPRAVLNGDFQAKRIQAAWDLFPFPEKGNRQEHALLAEQDWIPSPGGWKDVRKGHEYSFFFLYIEINMLDEWKKKSGSTHIDDIQEIFHRHIEETFKPIGGKIWMWMNNCGVVLFPFDGTSCRCIESCLRLILNRRIISIEEYGYNSLITYTMAVHLGNTIYKTRGDTGEIVSDSINFLFHIAKKYAGREHFYVTENVLPFLEPRLKELFLKSGTFEGVKMYSMKLPKK